MLKYLFLAVICLVTFTSCDHHGRVVVKELTCGGKVCDTADNSTVHFLPSKQMHFLGRDTLAVKADSLGMFFFSKFLCSPCKGCSIIEIQPVEKGPALKVNFFYGFGKAQLNNSDTLSTLGLLPFKGKTCAVREVFYEADKPAKVLGYIKFQ